MEETTSSNARTPWGVAQHQRVITRGVIFYSTAGHGGIHLSADKWQEFRKLFPKFQPWAGDTWLEEDCDYCLAVIAFPDSFSDESLASAFGFVSNYKSSDGGGFYFPEAREFLAGASEHARKIRERVYRHSKLELRKA